MRLRTDDDIYRARLVYLGPHPAYVGAFIDRRTEAADREVRIGPGYGDEQLHWDPTGRFPIRSRVGSRYLTLTKFLDAPRPTTESVILGFVATDIEQFVSNAVAAGSAVIEPIQSRPDHGVKVAFVKDIEGNLIEVVQIL